MNEADAHFWSDEIFAMIDGLAQLTATEFLDARNGVAARSSRRLDELCIGFAHDYAAWKRFMDTNPRPRQNWIPIDPKDLDGMDAHEIYYRLRENCADERWVDDALVEAFESGSLIAALEKIRTEITSFDVAERSPTPPARP